MAALRRLFKKVRNINFKTGVLLFGTVSTVAYAGTHVSVWLFTMTEHRRANIIFPSTVCIHNI